MFSGATLRVDGGGSLHSPQLWQIEDHDKIPEYSWDPYTDTNTNTNTNTNSKL